MVRPTGRYGVDETVSLSSNLIQILNELESGAMLYPPFFDNNIGWVKDGHLSEQEFLIGYYHEVEQGRIHRPITEPEPVPVTMYWIAKPSQIDKYSSNPLPQNFRAETYAITESTKQKWLDKGYVISDKEPVYSSGQTLWRDNVWFGKGLCTDGFNQYTRLRACESPIEQEQIALEPDVPEQMEFLCSDVYTLDNGSVVKTNYPTLSVPQIQNFISQGLMVRDCGTPSPTVSEVRSHYGYVPEPEETVPTEKFVVSKPGRLTISDMTNTNAWVGVLFAGALAVPVFSSILSKKK